MAFGVFLHHASIWYFYLRSGRWEAPPSHLYNHLGQTSVALFFMITGFLFVDKLMQARTKHIDWRALFVSRFFRITPLYAVLMGSMLLVVGIQTQWTMAETPSQAMQHTSAWLGFNFAGMPDINGLLHTFVIVAGVTWSLPYEWFFYLTLPLWGTAMGVRTPKWLVWFAAIVALSLLLKWHPKGWHLFAFGSGALAAKLARNTAWCTFARGRLASVLTIGLLLVLMWRYDTAYKTVPLLLLTLVFCLIACGQTAWGLLHQPVSIALGEMAYSLYLLHGMTLYVLMQWVLGPSLAASLTPTEHWLVIAALSPVLVCLCQASYRFIEHPAISWGRTFVQRSPSVRTSPT